MAKSEEEKAARKAQRARQKLEKKERRKAGPGGGGEIALLPLPARRMEAEPSSPLPGVLNRLDPAEILGDIDAWNLRREGGWYRFDARLVPGEPRAYLRRVEGHDIIADAPGPLLGLFALGGARRAGFNRGAPRFRHHILSPGDHIGSVGLEGTGIAATTADLQGLPHRSREALVAEHLLSWRHAACRGLPLHVVRAETDGASSFADLAAGNGYQNFLTALENFREAAASLGREARVLSVAIGFSLEDITSSSPGEFAAAFRALMAKIEADMRRRGLAPPIFLADAEAGTEELSDHPSIPGLWALAHRPGPHRLLIPGPSYWAEQNRFGRLSEAGRSDMAELDAHALAARLARRDWFAPIPLLAEWQGQEIRVTFRAMEPLVIDAEDPLKAGPAGGFRLIGTTRKVTITALHVASEDPKVLILSCSAPPEGKAPRLLHAFGLPPQGDGRPANRSRIRDSWDAVAATGHRLHRWALPADLPLHPLPASSAAAAARAADIGAEAEDDDLGGE